MNPNRKPDSTVSPTCTNTASPAPAPPVRGASDTPLISSDGSRFLSSAATTVGEKSFGIRNARKKPTRHITHTTMGTSSVPKLNTCSVPTPNTAAAAEKLSARTTPDAPFAIKSILIFSYTKELATAPTTEVVTACAAKYMAECVLCVSFSSTLAICAGIMYGIMKKEPIAQLPMTPPAQAIRYCTGLLPPVTYRLAKSNDRMATANEARQV